MIDFGCLSVERTSIQICFQQGFAFINLLSDYFVTFNFGFNSPLSVLDPTNLYFAYFHLKGFPKE